MVGEQGRDKVRIWPSKRIRGSAEVSLSVLGSARKFLAPDGKWYVWKTRSAVNDLKVSLYSCSVYAVAFMMLLCILIRLYLAYVPSSESSNYSHS